MRLERVASVVLFGNVETHRENGGATFIGNAGRICDVDVDEESVRAPVLPAPRAAEGLARVARGRPCGHVVPILRRSDIQNGHREELPTRVAISGDRRVVDLQKTKRL